MDRFKQRIDAAERQLRSMQNMEAFQGRAIITRQNVNLPAKLKEEFDDDSPLSFTLISNGPQDDDLRIQVGGVTVFNPKQNVGWYIGDSVDGGPGFNNDFQNSGFRSATITRDQAIKFGADWRYGAKVRVDTFDGWALAYRQSTWRVSIYWPNGITTRKSGGRNFTGVSSTTPTGAPDYYNTGPHFADYYPNGEFKLTN